MIHYSFLIQSLYSMFIFHIWLQLFKRWIALSTGQITIHWITQLVLQVFIRWTVIYPVNNAIHRLNNWGLIYFPQKTFTV